MKIRDIIPEAPQILETERAMNGVISNLSIMKAQFEGYDTYRSPSIGLDQVVNTWLRQQIAYRQQLIVDLTSLSFILEEVRAPVMHLVNEVFRRGLQWKPKFAYRCKICQTDYQDYDEKCEKCEELHTLYEPDEAQKENIKPFFKDANVFSTGLEQVLREVWNDVNIIDDGFIFLGKEYIASEDPDDMEVRSKVIEVQRLYPALIEFDLDQAGLPKNSHWLCYIHRDTSPATTEPGYCEECGRELIPAMYAYHDRNQIRYLFESEICHVSKFSPSSTYGFSPLLTVYEKVLTLIGMDRNLYRYFYERRIPPSMVMVFTDDPESVRREREFIAAQTRQDPNYAPIVAVSAKTNRGRVENVRFFHSLQEMDYLPVREEIRERIASMWGVTPMWQGAPEAYGGLSSQTPQLIVTSRVVESDQRVFSERIFPWLLDAFGITDWELELPQPEEKAEATRIAFAQQRVSIAQMLHAMGFKIEVQNQDVSIEDINFKVSGEAQSQDQMMGGMGGMGGGMYDPSGGYGGGDPSMMDGDQGMVDSGMEGELPPTQKSLDNHPMYAMAKSWIGQLQKAGHMLPLIKHVGNDGYVRFSSGGEFYIAKFNNVGNLTNITKDRISPGLHKHKGYPPHDINMPHNDNRKTPDRDTNLFEPEEPDEPEFL